MIIGDSDGVDEVADDALDHVGGALCGGRDGIVLWIVGIISLRSQLP